MGGKRENSRAAPPAGLAGLESAAARFAPRGPAPVHLWDPPDCGDIGMAIAADGTWFYLGSPIGRKALMRLFSGILRKDEDGRHYLVTPAEKVPVAVEDAPFLAVGMDVAGGGRDQTLAFRTNADDRVEADADHPLRFERAPGNDGLKPYLLVRGQLEARLTRSLYYDLVALAVTEVQGGAEKLGVWSGGTFFPMARADEIVSG